MAITQTFRFGLYQWSSGADAPLTRNEANSDNLSVETHAAGWLTPDVAANRPAAAAANAGFFFRATDTGALSISTGSAWFNIPLGTYLATSGGSLTGFVDYQANELRNPTVVQARDKGFSANISGAAVIDAANGPSQVLTMTGNVTGITVNNLNDRESLRIELIQDATGSRTIAFPGTWIWPGGATVATAGFATAPNAKNVLVLEKIVSTIEAFLALDMKA